MTGSFFDRAAGPFKIEYQLSILRRYSTDLIDGMYDNSGGFEPMLLLYTERFLD